MPPVQTAVICPHPLRRIEVPAGTQITFFVRGVLSTLLANLYLHSLDTRMSGQGYAIVRYTENFVILCATEAGAHHALVQVQAWTAAQGLTLHPDKTHLGDCRQAGQGFDFLGYRFEG